MRFNRRARAAWMMFLMLAAPAGAGALNVPLESPVYSALEVLASRGRLDTRAAGIRPLSRYEVRAFLAEARERREGSGGDAAVDAALAALEREVSAWEDGIIVRRPRAVAVYRSGTDSAFPGTNASQFALLYNNQGIQPVDHRPTVYFGIPSEVSGGPFSGCLRPLLRLDDDEADADIAEGYLQFCVPRLSVEIGRESLWWGQGGHGSLLLSNNAEALNLIRVRNPDPLLLPGVFRHLGLFFADVFAARLEGNRDHPHAILWGTRLAVKPRPAWEIAVSRTVMMGGTGMPGITPRRFWRILTGENPAGSLTPEDLSNSLMTVDARFTVKGCQLYGEFGGEDEAGGFFSKEAWLAGAFWPALATRMDLRLEYADISDEFWYRHASYTSGYTYRGRVLGHHAGGEARDAYVEWGYSPTDRARGAVFFDYEQRGVAQPVTERHHQAGISWRQQVDVRGQAWSVEGAAGVDQVRNVENVAGQDRDRAMMMVTVQREW